MDYCTPRPATVKLNILRSCLNCICIRLINSWVIKDSTISDTSTIFGSSTVLQSKLSELCKFLQDYYEKKKLTIQTAKTKLIAVDKPAENFKGVTLIIDRIRTEFEASSARDRIDAMTFCSDYMSLAKSITNLKSPNRGNNQILRRDYSRKIW